MSDINRRAWNLSMPLHQKVNQEFYDKAFKDCNYSVLNSVDSKYLLDVIKIKGKSVVQLCCNNGVELMSIYNLGAKKLVGYDLSDVAIEEGRKRCCILNYPIQFHQMDIFDIKANECAKSDVVYISVGSIRWLDDLNELYRICRELLVPGGSLYISDVHPLAEIINDDRDLMHSPLEIICDYKHCKKRDIGSLDYIGHTNEVLVDREWYIHTFTEIIGYLPVNGFRLVMFKEFEEDLSGVYQLTSKQSIKVPLSFRLEAIAL